MRKLLAVLAALTLAGAAPAHAEPAVHVVTIEGSIYDTTVTCDTSSYPAPWYPCQLDVTVADGCIDPVAGGFGCTLSVHGVIHAVPSPYPNGACSLTSYDVPWLTLTYDAGSYHAEQPIQPFTIVPRAGVVYGSSFAYTSWEIVLEAYGAPADGAMRTGFVFDDLAYDCRTNDGGDPAAVGSFVWPLGEFVFAQT